MQDLRLALRSLAAAPIVSGVAIISLVADAHRTTSVGPDGAGAGLKAVESQIRQATIPPNFPKQFADQYLAGREGFIAVPAATGNSTLRRRYERPLLAILVVVALICRSNPFGVVVW